jgi:hypothetical protein|eukprot:COSAG01_NODE_10846_length_2068_cov_36.072626_2_plen_153_part_00
MGCCLGGCRRYGLSYLCCALAGGVGAAWLGCWLRGRVRERLGIGGSPIQDYWIHCCCPLCAMYQEYSTLSRRVENFSVSQTLRDTARDMEEARELLRKSSVEAASEQSARGVARGELKEALAQGMDRGARGTPPPPKRSETVRQPQHEATSI